MFMCHYHSMLYIVAMNGVWIMNRELKTAITVSGKVSIIEK